jgi:hypothetical protein
MAQGERNDVITWYRDRSDSQRTWPHLVLSNKLILTGEIGIKRRGSTEKTIDIEYLEHSADLPNILLGGVGDTWDTLTFDFHIFLDEEENEITDVCSDIDDAELAIFVNCDASKYQKCIKADYVSPITHLEFEIQRNNFFHKLVIEPMVLLKVDYDPDPSEDYAYMKGSILATSDSLDILTDQVGNLFGGKISEQYKPFTGKNRDCLYQFSITDDKPIIWWNTRFKQTIALLRQNTPEGHPRTLLRDFVMRSVCSSVMYDLASRLAPADEEDTYDPESIYYNLSKSVGKTLKKNKIEEILRIFSTCHELHDQSEISSKMQHYYKVGPAIEKLVSDHGEES